MPSASWWVKATWVALLLVVCYLPVIIRLATQWYNDADMGHGFFVPVVAGYIAWAQRERWLNLPVKPNYWGLVLLGWGFLQLVMGTLAAELFLQRTSLILSLAGCVLFLGGTQVFRAVLFPLFLLVFMVPIPAVIYNHITFPLQLLASRVAESVLNMTNIPVLRDGNVLELANGQRLSVVEACSGIRSLLTLSFLALVYGFFFDQKAWMKWVLLIATIPLAIAANAGRVTITGVLSNYNPELAQGVFHTMEGWVVFAVDLVLLVATQALIKSIYHRFNERRSTHQSA